MTIMRVAGPLVALTIAALVETFGWTPHDTSLAAGALCGSPRYPVGYRIIPFKESREAAVWYPTSTTQTTFAYSRDISTTLAENGVPLTACGRFPLVVFAHGLFGCGVQSIFFTEELARHGYVVVAPDYRDAATCHIGSPSLSNSFVKEPSIFRPQDWSASSYQDRKVDTEQLITMMERDAAFGPMIDATRVGMAGHSLGGYTALGLVGAWPSWRDSRISVALLFSPYTNPFTAHSTMGGVHVPLMYQSAQGDIGVAPFVDGPNGAFALSNAPKYYAKLFRGSHLSWTNFVCAGTQTTSDCLRSSATARLIDAYGIAFLDEYLKGRKEAILTSQGVGFATYYSKP
ncbi:MAG: alpha/beta fold hydrolase [Candidatus Eremiobacteraeota bacterium]|nr:alpha/beta fold hydrolase [Candidatus Eremiobacteraeota bacterium]